jgi:pimeloyl-ACP methyl ester carboxylesterase
MKASKTSPVTALMLALVVSLLATAASAQQRIAFNVSVTGGSAPVSVTVYENPDARVTGATVLAVHGFTETAAAWQPLTAALFSHPATKNRVKRMIALDLPGHGYSPLPTLATPANFGSLTIYDNVSVVIQAIDYLRAHGLGARVLMGHSMGGLAIQAVQEKLLANGSSLSQHGVYRAILLAPVPVANITAWTPAAATIPTSYYRFDNGTYIVIDNNGALFGGGFSTTASTPTAPVITPAAFALNFTGLIGAEPSVTAGQLVGAIPTLPRPSARQGAFAPLVNGTLLTIIGFSEDILTPAALQPALYQHLLGRQGLMYQEVVAADAVHAMFITNPRGMLDQLFSFGDMF